MLPGSPRSFAVVAVLVALLTLAALTPRISARLADNRPSEWTTADGGGGGGQTTAVLARSLSDIVPFDPFPAITLPTTAGPLAIGGGPSEESYTFVGYSSLSPLSEVLWAASIDTLIATSPMDAHYVFVSYTEDEVAHAAEMAAIGAKVDAAISALTDQAAQEHWRRHIHLVTANPLHLASPVPELLTAWSPTLAEVRGGWTDASGTHHTLREIGTTDSGWAAPLTGTLAANLGLYGPAGSQAALACPPSAPVAPVTGSVALVARGTCYFTDKVGNAQAHGAIGVLAYTDDREKGTMAGTCNPCPTIPVAMIDHAPGLELSAALEAGRPVTVAMAPLPRAGVELMAVDHQSRARELGSVPYPFNEYLESPIDAYQMVTYATTYFHYEHERDQRLTEEEDAGKVTRVPVLVGQWVSDPGWTGETAYADVQLPDAASMAAFDTLEVDLTLSCPDHKRSNCPSWDYIADMSLCATGTNQCDVLVGRWITPYWAEGHWLTDITPILGWLSDGGLRRFAFYTQQRYQVDLALRLSNRGKALVPKRAVDLGLNGGPFWDRYNTRFHPIDVQVPDWTDRVEIVSFVTGHGFGKDAANCAEFCNHTHHISVNGAPEHVRGHPETDRVLGCAERVPGGVVPNQGGTWVYGRGGWCPGLDVQPWVIDVTSEITPGIQNVVTYRGLFQGEDYVPEPADPANPGGYDANIRMRSYMVYWAQPGDAAGPVPPAVMRNPGVLYLPRTLAERPH